MPLSEEEQRILQEMEQTLREHDREFVARVDHHAHRLDAAIGGRWAVLTFFAGAALLFATFWFSIVLGSLGFFIMVASALIFGQHLRSDATSQQAPGRRVRSHGANADWSDVKRRMRSRFGHHD